MEAVTRLFWRALGEIESKSDGGLWRGGVANALDFTPSAERNHRAADFERQADFGESTGFAREGNDGSGAGNDDHIARVTHPGRDSEFNMKISGIAIIVRQNTDGVAIGCSRACRSGLHHAGASAANQDGTARGDATADFASERERLT